MIGGNMEKLTGIPAMEAQLKRYFDNPNDPTQAEALKLAYDTIHAILTQWEEKKLEGDFFHTPMDLYETLATLAYTMKA